MKRVTAAQRRARLAHRHRLAAGRAAAEPTEVARDLVALHSTDPATVYLSAAARLVDPAVEPVDDALYERRTLVRMLGMRRTMFVVPVEAAPVVQAACTDAIAVTQRRTLVQHLAQAGIGDSAWLDDVATSTLAALAARGSATAVELSDDEPRLRTRLTLGTGKSYDVPTNITTRVLMLLSMQGHIVRGRPRGSWISSQYRWWPAERWLPGPRPALTAERARTELARHWLAAYGPATLADLKWWTGWTLTQARAAVSTLDTEPVDLDGVPGVMLADARPEAEPETGPWIALLPALDPTVMGWVQRDWYLGPYGPALFDRSGNPGPTVWCAGRIVGGWAQRPDGRVVVRLLEEVGRVEGAAIDAEAERLTDWLGPVRVTPRFRTPMERELGSA
jgi:hypothetical protein